MVIVWTNICCVCVCVLYETVNDSGELTSVTTRSMSAANNSYSMSSDNYEDERLLNVYLYIEYLGTGIDRICEITDVMNEESEE